MRVLTAVMLPFVALWLALRGLARWVVQLPVRLGAILTRVGGAITVALERVAASLAALGRHVIAAMAAVAGPVIDIVASASVRMGVALRVAGRAVGEVVLATARHLHALGSRAAALLRATARLLARVWSRLVAMAREVASIIEAVSRPIGRAIRLLSARVGVALRDVARLVVAPLRPFGRLVRSIAARAAVVMGEALRVVAEMARRTAQHAAALANGLGMRARILARGSALVARLGWTASSHLTRAMARRLQVALLLGARTVGRATDALLVLAQELVVKLLVPLRTSLGRAAHIVVGPTLAAMSAARRALASGLWLAMVPIAAFWAFALRFGRSAHGALRRAASLVRESTRPLVDTVRHATRAVRGAARQAATASRAALHSASAAILLVSHNARTIGHRRH